MEKELYGLTCPQKLIWFTQEFFKGTPIENITGTVIIPEKVDFSMLKTAINIYVERNDSFRLKFINDNNDIKQFVDSYKKFDIETINVTSDDDLNKVGKEIAEASFECINSYLFVFKLIRFPDNHGGFIINMHHLISDAWTAGNGATEIIKIYNLLLKNEDVSEIQYPSYIDFINSEQEYLNSEKFNKDKAFWANMFETVPEVATIPSMKQSDSTSMSSSARRKQFELSKELINNISVFCKSNNFSVFNFFMSVFAIYIGRVSNLNEFVIGTPILNRTNVKEKRTSGMFISTVPLKVNLENNIKFADLASSISSTFFNIFKHQKYSYLSLLEDLRKKDSSLPNLYNILLSYQNIRSSAQTSEVPYNINWVPNGDISDDVEIHIYDMNDTGNINIAYDYKTSKYDERDIIDTHNRIVNMINQVLENGDITINEMDIVTPEEKNKILYEFNNTQMDYPKDKTIAQLFEEQVKKTPDNIALVFEDKSLTYKELNEKANSLANYLRNIGINRNDIIGIMLHRSLEMFIAILAVLKAGGTYIPIDPEYPQDRVEYMLNNSHSKLLLTQKELEENINYDKKLNIDLSNSDIYGYKKTNPECVNSNQDLTYIIYTSGSTGLPKGVMLKNINVVNFIYATVKALNLNSNNVIVSVTTISFDIFVLESLLPLTNGMKVIVANEQTQTDAKLFNDLCEKNKVDVVQTTPSRLQAFLFDEKISTFIDKIKFLLLGGEPFPQKLLNKLHDIYHGKIYNMYGPTETAVWSSIKDLSDTKSITIGKPIGNTQMYVLDKFLNPLPIGIPGELYISGDGVCKGYLNKPDLTQKSFLTNKFINNSTIYKTGDFCQLLPNGDFNYLERIDNQVKIRGLRIELGEIETCICTFPNIEKCVAIVNNQKIIAYYSAAKTINIVDLKAYLQTKLPSYFIPSFFILVNKFKMTPNGKIDRKALSKLEIPTESEYEPPQTEYQKKLAQTFKTVLGISKISINDNFFEIGGDSLSAIKLQIEAFNKGLDLSYKDIFNYPTIKLLSQNVLKAEKNIAEDDYNYDNINALIRKNSTIKKLKMKKDPIKNVLLTGCTGFMGSHILDYLLKHTRSNVYCLIRAKNNTDPQVRLLEVLHFYFGNKYDKLIFKRIFAVEGNITNKKLGLNNLYYEELGRNINCVINCAAIVKHYGNSDIFKDTNIIGTKNIVDFCKKFNCKLVHISTLSVSGNIFNDDNIANYEKEISFSEKDLYINQDLSNIYIKTKFLAERLILENILENNLNAKIIRLGNITNRYSDGAFQINVSENAFVNRIHSFIKIGCAPSSLKDLPVEFTPVDICANAIINIAKYNNPYTIFHIFNNNYITFEKLVKVLKTFGIKINFIEDESFNKKVKEFSKNDETKHMLSGIINDFSKNSEIKYVNNIKMQNSFTNKYLSKTMFKWPKINEKYIKKYVTYLKTIGYI